MSSILYKLALPPIICILTIWWKMISYFNYIQRPSHNKWKLWGLSWITKPYFTNGPCFARRWVWEFNSFNKVKNTATLRVDINCLKSLRRESVRIFESVLPQNSPSSTISRNPLIKLPLINCPWSSLNNPPTHFKFPSYQCWCNWNWSHVMTLIDGHL